MSDKGPTYNIPDFSYDLATESVPEGGERLLHYVWLNRLWMPSILTTADGKTVEIVNPGRVNLHAGPDFFNATVRIDGTEWAGNIEIHFLSSDWYRHGHDKDAHYNNVVLHVCERVDCEVLTAAGQSVPQVEIQVPDYVRENYKKLLSEMEYPPCFRVLPGMPAIALHGWLDHVSVERLEQKTERIVRYLDITENDWERVFFITLARAFGFGVNSEVFEHWAMQLPLMSVAHHRDDLFQVEAFFFGQAGMLDDSFPKEKDEYFLRLQSEYAFLKNKFGLTPMDSARWKFLRMRPQNFPTIRLAQLAMLYTQGALSLRSIIETDSLEKLRTLLSADVSDYWHTHYVFGKESVSRTKRIQKDSLHRLVINAVCPTLFAYGRYNGKEELAERAFDLLQELPAEDNHIVRRWAEVGMSAQSASDSQALIHLYNAYCQRKDCLRCVIGREYLKVKEA